MVSYVNFTPPSGRVYHPTKFGLSSGPVAVGNAIPDSPSGFPTYANIEVLPERVPPFGSNVNEVASIQCAYRFLIVELILVF